MKNPHRPLIKKQFHSSKKKVPSHQTPLSFETTLTAYNMKFQQHHDFNAIHSYRLSMRSDCCQNNFISILFLFPIPKTWQLRNWKTMTWPTGLVTDNEWQYKIIITGSNYKQTRHAYSILLSFSQLALNSNQFLCFRLCFYGA